MPSFLDKLRSGSAGASTASSAPNKKDGKEVPQTWLQKLAQDTDPVNINGSDKFLGAENFGNTCYFNSMVQCLYYSIPFREMVLAYPRRSPVESILNGEDGLPRKNVKDGAQLNGQAVASPAKKNAATPASSRSAGVAANNQKPEDKDSPEYKKKQAMLHGPVLSVDYDNSGAYQMSPSLFTCLKDAFEAVIANKSRTGVLSLPRFLEKLRQENDMFRSPMHQDAHEFLNLLLNAVLDSVEEHTKTLEKQEAAGVEALTTAEGEALLTAEQSKIAHGQFRRLFQGTLTSETRCLTCENVSQRDEPFLDLSVDLEQHSSVTSCLRQFSEEEMLCERDKFFCDGCGGLQEAEKRMKVKRLPKVLALHLKRFKYTEDLQRLHKLFDRVVYPYQLRLFNTTDDAEDPDKLYELYAVVVHIGSGPYHGHYVTIIKTPDRGWLLFDDEMVEPVDKSFVRNFFGAQIGMACAYVLFYQETTLEKVKEEQEAEGLAAAAAATAAEIHQPPLQNEKEAQAVHLALKMNGGHGGGHALAPHEEPMAKLTHVVTAPATASSPTVYSPSVATPSMPTAFGVAPLGTSSTQPSQTKAEAALAKKQAAKEEKERKAAEKEREKSEKKRRKSMEFLSKSQAAIVRNSMHKEKVPDLPSNGSSATHQVQLPLDTNVKATGLSSPTAASTALPLSAVEAPSPTAAEANLGQLNHQHASSFSSSPTSGWNKGGLSSLSLKRSSKSISRKGKFWPSLSNSEGKSGSVAHSLGPPPTSAPMSDAVNTPSEPTPFRNGDDFAVEDTDSGPEGQEKEPLRREHTYGDLASPGASERDATSPAAPKKRGFSMIRKKASSLMS